jgi:hypothetical protein
LVAVLLIAKLDVRQISERPLELRQKVLAVKDAGPLEFSDGQNCYKILAGVLLVNASRIRRTRNARRPFPGDRGVAEDHHELREMVE